MRTSRWLSTLVLPLALLAAAAPGIARAASINDRASLFSARTVSRAQEELDRIERESKLPTTIETIASLEGESARDVLRRHAKQSGASGLYILIAKKEARIEVEPQNKYRPALPSSRTDAIRDAFVDAFKQKDFDRGLEQGVRTIGLEASVAQSQLEAIARGATVPVAGGRREGAAPPGRRVNQGGSFGLGSLLTIGLLIVGGLFLMRLIGSLFGGNRGYGAPGNPMMGQPGYGGGPGYGYGGGGGFLSSLFGGIGGAMAGNWIYDQMTGRRHYGGGEHAESAAYGSGLEPGPAADPNGNDWTSSGSSGGWGDDSGGSSGGDWGGGGGDWGGSSGGDWGGGGGDWGGGGGGSDGGW